MSGEIQQVDEEIDPDFPPLRTSPTLQQLMGKEDQDRDQIMNEETETKYVQREPIGVASGATVYNGSFHPKWTEDYDGFEIYDAFVSLKVVNLRQQEEYNRLNQEVERSRLVAAHDNIVGIRDSFTYRHRFFVVMPCMDRGSLRTIMSSRFPNGLPEKCIVVALRESLTGLSFLHGNGHLHKDINAGHIFLYRTPAIQLGFAATIYEHNGDDNQASSSTAMPATTICTWAAAPEVYNNPDNNAYTAKADIWLIGITALELIYGGLRAADRESLEEIIKKMTRKRKLPKRKKMGLAGEKKSSSKKKLVDRGKEKGKKLLDLGKRLVSGEWRKRRFLKDFGNMVIQCLAWDAADRPTADQLLQNKVFTEAEDVIYFDQVIEGKIKL